jgi:molybdopterin-guanine dinucleotide biosynthesis protein A
MAQSLLAPLCGILVGGKSRRMGGYPKGLLPAPGSLLAENSGGARSLVERLSALCMSQGLSVVLVGQHADYSALGLPLLADQPPGRGPLGGLRALLAEAAQRGHDSVLALSCDLPYFDLPLLDRLLHSEASGFDAVAPRWTPPDRPQPLWEPLCARYFQSFTPHLANALAADSPSLQQILSQAKTLALPLDESGAAQVKDWDCPDDLPDGIKPALRHRSS